MAHPQAPLPWLDAGDAFPDVTEAWRAHSPAPGLLAAGGALDVATLVRAYSNGIFPWYSAGQPVLWWSPDPRMVLPVADFKLHRSLRKTIARFRADARCEVRFDSDFAAVIAACSGAPREGQDGTWIVPDIIAAYTALHQAGHAHSVETWIDGALAGGLYCVNLGRAVFGESMFSHQTDASKIALAALVAFCRVHGIALIDCQQNTGHLASLGAREIERARFVHHLRKARAEPRPAWHFEPIYWNQLLPAQA
ncbi:MAG: leucyl/phenylalanyl-tRNA--protein transferase [Pseudomonadota bacterium]